MQVFVDEKRNLQTFVKDSDAKQTLISLSPKNTVFMYEGLMGAKFGRI